VALCGVLAARSTGIWVLTVTGFAAAGFLLWEAVIKTRMAKADAWRVEWPGFIEYLVAAFESGITPHETLIDAANYFDSTLQGALAKVRQELVAGETPHSALRKVSEFSRFPPALTLAVRLEAYAETGHLGSQRCFELPPLRVAVSTH